jgi:hypothetical protein
MVVWKDDLMVAEWAGKMVVKWVVWKVGLSVD